MFCPSCGTESTGLNYCNRCGANLTAPITTTTDAAPINLTKPMLIVGTVALAVTLGGFFMILESATVLARSTGAGGDLPMAIVFFGMVTVLTLDILLLRQLSKLITAALSPERRALQNQTSRPASTFQLPHPSTAKLAQAPSVTENTTRFFDANSPSAIPEPVTIKKTDR